MYDDKWYLNLEKFISHFIFYCSCCCVYEALRSNITVNTQEHPGLINVCDRGHYLESQSVLRQIFLTLQIFEMRVSNDGKYWQRKKRFFNG